MVSPQVTTIFCSNTGFQLTAAQIQRTIIYSNVTAVFCLVALNQTIVDSYSTAAHVQTAAHTGCNTVGDGHIFNGCSCIVANEQVSCCAVGSTAGNGTAGEGVVTATQSHVTGILSVTTGDGAAGHNELSRFAVYVDITAVIGSSTVRNRTALDFQNLSGFHIDVTAATGIGNAFGYNSLTAADSCTVNGQLTTGVVGQVATLGGFAVLHDHTAAQGQSLTGTDVTAVLQCLTANESTAGNGCVLRQNHQVTALGSNDFAGCGIDAAVFKATALNIQRCTGLYTEVTALCGRMTVRESAAGDGQVTCCSNGIAILGYSDQNITAATGSGFTIGYIYIGQSHSTVNCNVTATGTGATGNGCAGNGQITIDIEVTAIAAGVTIFKGTAGNGYGIVYIGIHTNAAAIGRLTAGKGTAGNAMAAAIHKVDMAALALSGVIYKVTAGNAQAGHGSTKSNGTAVTAGIVFADRTAGDGHIGSLGRFTIHIDRTGIGSGVISCNDTAADVQRFVAFRGIGHRNTCAILCAATGNLCSTINGHSTGLLVDIATIAGSSTVGDLTAKSI